MREIIAKTIISPFRERSTSYKRFTYNPYRGCQHACIYCDSRSLCYGIDDFEDVAYKSNAVELLETEMKRKRKKGIIYTGSMSDPYLPAEEELEITKRSLEVIRDCGFGVQITTKSDLIARDLDLLKDISERYCSVVFTLTTTDEMLANKIEAAAPSPSRRIAAIQALVDGGIHVGIAMTPILPFIEDDEDNLSAILTTAKDAGASFVYASTGMTLRDRQREYYYKKLDQYFPGLTEIYRKTYGDMYSCSSPKSRELKNFIKTKANLLGIRLLSFGEPIVCPDLDSQRTLF
ncbi:radical SAM protein [Mesotoga sp. BH458_6_3_2_1]|uniref:SPL family radical SAM protein n=1 Tax=Mesotoga sp. BH458_6_3_2_1 TaxID=1437446 RepID=UPI000EF2820B|nr:radical SAM protein [Mesotoga sp. BH458_6_3_2_1]RLL83476.1 hypothetical protein Y697_14230 [Mesotoga sp. BH458_6_3_2_1]